MKPVLLQALAIAAGGLLSVGSILIVLLLLSTAQGLRKSFAYYLGYSLSYLTIGALFVLIGGRFHAGGGSQRAGALLGSSLFVVLGVLFLFFALRRWRTRPPKDAVLPRWLTALDRTRPLKLFGFGVMIPVLNFKNLAIYLSAASTIPGNGLTVLETTFVLVAIVLTFSAAVLFPIILFALVSERALPLLEAMKRGLTRHNRTLGIVLLTLFGVIFLVRGIRGLG